MTKKVLRRGKKNRGHNRISEIVIAVFVVIGILFGTFVSEPQSVQSVSFSLSDVEAYSGESYTVVNGNVPYFTEEEMSADIYEEYEPLDDLGRATGAVAMIDETLFPTEERGSIGMIKPTGWQTVRYDDLIEGKYLYNRCHLIGYQLTGENANELNLITGTRYMNVDGMLPWENMVHDYIENTGDAVLYRVTPIYEGDDLVARGVLMEARSRSGELSFCIFCYNVQPGIEIDYSDGSSWRA